VDTSAPAAPLPCVMDIEASGFGPGSYPIEVGWALPDGRTRCTLVRPPPHWTHWDTRAEQVHHIERSALLRAGRPATEVAAMLNADLAGCTVYCDGWAHDFTWLGALFEEAGGVPAFRLESVHRLLQAERLPELDEAQRRARSTLGLHRHRASADARALQHALGELTSPSHAAPR
jgi:hypothetical protein